MSLPPSGRAPARQRELIPVVVADETEAAYGDGHAAVGVDGLAAEYARGRGSGGRDPRRSAPAMKTGPAEVGSGPGLGKAIQSVDMAATAGGGKPRGAHFPSLTRKASAGGGRGQSTGGLFGRRSSSRNDSKSGRFVLGGVGRGGVSEFAEDEFKGSGSDAHMIAFVNRSSGGNEGAAIMEVFQKMLGGDVVFDIKADGGPERGLELHASDPRVEVRVLVAGGDGTFSWVANAVDQQALRNVRLVVIPLGSGNDMARALGWGKKAPTLAQIPQYIEWARRAPSRVLDVWRLVAVNAPSVKDNAGASKDSDGVVHGARPLVCNYLSLGADAHVELQFNQRRWDAPDKYTSRMGNFRAHMVVGLQYITTEKRINVSEHVETLTVDGKVVQLPPNLQALIFCNIPSYGAGTQPWGFPRGGSKPMFVNDGFFEVIGLHSLHHFNRMKALPTTHGVRICQGSSMEIKLKSARTPFQVDGEPWEQLGGTVALAPGNPVGVLPGPRFSHRSRKNAKFETPGDNTDGTFGMPDRTLDDIGIGSPRHGGKESSPGPGPALLSGRPPASFG